MLARLDLRDKKISTAELRRALPRGGTDVDSVIPAVEPVVREVRLHGASAALEFGRRFDGCSPRSVQVPPAIVDLSLIHI